MGVRHYDRRQELTDIAALYAYKRSVIRLDALLLFAIHC